MWDRPGLGVGDRRGPARRTVPQPGAASGRLGNQIRRVRPARPRSPQPGARPVCPATSASTTTAAVRSRRTARVLEALFLLKMPGFVSGWGGGARAAALQFLEPQPLPQRLPRDSTFAITVKYP